MHWWQTGILYQVYPRSFQDANGDGVGDLPGIIERLPYLSELGVDAVWLSPIFRLADGRLRLRHFRLHRHRSAVRHHARFRRAALPRRMRAASRCCSIWCPITPRTGIRWFIESRAARDNAKRDWYIWRDPAPGGGPPNNWLSEFGGSAWEFDEATGQYYYHAFLKAQPDLNWRNARSARGDPRRDALLAQARRRRLPRRRDLASDQGRALPRQSAQSAISRRRCRITSASRRSIRPTGRRCMRSSAACAPWSTNSPSAC